MEGERDETAAGSEQRDGLSRRALLNTAGAIGGGVLAASVLAAPASAQTPTAPITANRFVLTIDGFQIATFSELVGISTEVEPSQYLDSSSTGPALSKLPGKQKPPTIVLKRGMTRNLDLWSWHESARLGQLSARRSCSLTMFDSSGAPVSKYFLQNAWPSKIDVSALKAGSNDVLTETVTLTMEALHRVAP